MPRFWRHSGPHNRADPVPLAGLRGRRELVGNGYPQRVMALNGVEAGLLALWVLGVVAALLAGARGGFTVRARVALLTAILLPVLGSLLAIAYLGLTLARNPRGTTPTTSA